MWKLRPQAPSADRRIVLIDDQRDHLAYMTTLLARHGYSSAGFASARDALDHIENHQVDLVIADVFMPDMDGFELLRILQRRSAPIPVVTLSGGDRRGHGDFFLRCTRLLGAVATLRKPLHVDALLVILDSWVPLERGVVSRVRQTVPSDTLSSPQASRHDTGKNDVEN
ncbi:MAG TPA: response regulator [Stellaceae bacterium]|jgi:CheY-like chemotaxis protein|nr:response regulator [Stellaceae bacterium]